MVCHAAGHSALGSNCAALRAHLGADAQAQPLYMGRMLREPGQEGSQQPQQTEKCGDAFKQLWSARQLAQVAAHQCCTRQPAAVRQRSGGQSSNSAASLVRRP